MELNLEQYTREFLNKKDVLTKISAGTPETDLTEEDKFVLNFQAVPNYYTYKLCGVIIHSGTADSGHYISVAVDRESESIGQWYEFNDARVSKFNPDLMQVEAFGTNEKVHRSSCGYMLIYERNNYFHMPIIKELFEFKDPEKIKAGFENAQIDYNTLMTVKLSEDAEKKLVSENAKYRQTKLILNPNYIDTINTLINQLNINIEETKSIKNTNLQQIPFTDNTALEHLQFFTIYTLTIMLRVTLRSEYNSFLEVLTNAADNHLEFSVWLLECFAYPEIIQEFFVSCPIPKARFFVASLLTAAFNTVYIVEEKRIEKYIKDPKLFHDKLNTKAELKVIREESKEEVYFLNYPKKGLPYCLLFLHNILVKMGRVLENRRLLFEYFFLLSSICRRHTILISFLFRYEMLGVLLEVLLETSGESIKHIKTYKPIIINKELNLGFQKTDTETNGDPDKRLFASSMTRDKHYHFVVELLSLVTL
jgi:hypothetical protein